MHDLVATELLRQLRELIELQRTEVALLRRILHRLDHPLNRVLGGVLSQTGEIVMTPIAPGNTPKFLVTPAFSGAPFTLDGSKAAVTSSDPANFPVELDLTDDPQGLTFDAPIPATAQPVGGSEPITVTWTYTNPDGVVATVTGTVTEVGIVDDVIGGTFAQVA